MYEEITSQAKQAVTEILEKAISAAKSIIIDGVEKTQNKFN